jgi:hypothetical protein
MVKLQVKLTVTIEVSDELNKLLENGDDSAHEQFRIHFDNQLFDCESVTIDDMTDEF